MVRRKSISFVLAFLCLSICALSAQSYNKGARLSGDVLAVGIPVGAMVTTLLKKDYQGSKQLVFAGGSSMAVTYILKGVIDKQRPDGSNHNSFPSAHTAVSFMGATFVQQRYGWQYGVPAYVLSTYVAWTRMYAKKHDIWDVTAGAAIGALGSFIFTRPFASKHNLVFSPVMLYNKPGVYASFVF